MRDAVIVEAVRTPVGKGKPGGSLSGVHPADLLAGVLESVVERAGVDPAVVDDVIVGCVSQAGEQAANIARRATLGAGYPEQVPATTVDRQCGSSQQALSFAAQGVISGAYDVAVVGGVESMSRVPMGSAAQGVADFAGERYTARYPDGGVSQGVAAELIAARWGLSRSQLDGYAARSHARAAEAWRAGLFAEQVVPVKARQGDGSLALVTTDETVRPGTDLETLARLRPAFYDERVAARFPEIDWRVTPGNSSPLNDGAAALLVTTSDRARELGLTPRARIHTTTVVGNDPLMMLTAVIPATEKVLRRAGLSIDDIDLFEVNEAFASVVLAWQAETGVTTDKVNVHGGGISIGHPLGASGARIATTLVDALHQRGARFGLQTMCEAGGLANATIFERL